MHKCLGGPAGDAFHAAFNICGHIMGRIHTQLRINCYVHLYQQSAPHGASAKLVGSFDTISMQDCFHQDPGIDLHSVGENE